MNMVEYITRYGPTPGLGDLNYYTSDKPKTWGRAQVIEECMVQFTADTAWAWGGPYNGNYAHLCLLDYSTNTEYLKSLDKGAREEQDKRDRMKEKLIGIYTPQGVPKDKRPWWWDQCELPQDRPSMAKPFAIYASGNDDTSYTKYFSSLEEALSEWSLLLECQPLDLYKDILEMGGWAFTN